MKLTTTTYKQIIASGETRNWNIKIDITLADDTVLPSLTEADITQFSMETAISGDSTFDIGSAIIGMCKFTIENFRETYSQYDFFNATAVVWVKLVGDSEYHRMGFYTIDEPVFNGNMVSLELLDNMWKFDVPLSEVPIIYPISVGDAVSAICSYCGVVKATLSFNGDSFIVGEPEQDMNCREFLQYLAMIGCNFCVINPSGSLEIKWYQSVTPSEDDLDGGSFNTNTTPYSDGDSADGGNFTDYSSGDSYDGGTFTDNSNIDYFTRNFSVSQGTDEITITGVKIAIGDVEYSRGTEGYMLVLTNPFITDSNVSSFLNLVWGRLNGFKLRPFQISCLPDIAAEVGDYCAFTDAKGNMSYSWVTCINFNVSSMEVRCSAQSPTRTLTRQYSKAIQTAVEEARKVTDKGISDYDVMVQLMNNIAINAMGAYMDYEDIVTGGRIYYLSNRPITKSGGSCSFQSGSTVYKMSGDGFFVSTNGGQTWTNGYDSQTGNLVVNVLSAIGIVADWVQTGKIKDRYNINYWDLDTGDLRMTAGAKIRETTPDYSGQYVPTNANSPAVDWTTQELKQANAGKTFNNTLTTPPTTYIYKGEQGYPETAHPYSNNETAYYKFETGLTAPIKIKFNSQSETESAERFDNIDLYYTQSGTTYTRRLGGAMGGLEVIIPTSDFYLYWHTDGSVTYWGWKIDSIESTSGSPSGFSTGTLPTATWVTVDKNYRVYDWKEATLDNYVGGVASGIVPTDADVTLEAVYNALTNYGQNDVIVIQNGQVWIKGTWIQANTINADKLGAGIIKIGGNSTIANTRPTIEVYDDNANPPNKVGEWSRDGFVVNKGTVGCLDIIQQGTYSGSSELYINSTVTFYDRKRTVSKNTTIRTSLYPYRDGFTYAFTPKLYVWVEEGSYSTGRVLGIAYIRRKTEGGTWTKVTQDSTLTMGDYSFAVTVSFYDTNGNLFSITPQTNTIYQLVYEYRYYNDEEKIEVKWFSENVKSPVISNKDISGTFRGRYTGKANLTSLLVSDIDGNSVDISDYGDYIGISNESSTDYSQIFPDEITQGRYSSASSQYTSSMKYNALKMHVFSNNGNVDEYTNLTSSNLSRKVYSSSSSSYTTQSVSWSSSDERGKMNIQPLDVEISKKLIDGSEPKSFEYLGISGKHYGMTAQDARRLLNRIGEGDSALEHSMGIPDEETGMQDQRTIDYHEYIPHIINYIKRQEAEINELKAEIKALKGE